MMHNDDTFEVSDWDYFFANWPTTEEVNNGWHQFWGNTQLLRTYRDSSGKNLKDKHGNILLTRSTTCRQMPMGNTVSDFMNYARPKRSDNTRD